MTIGYAGYWVAYDLDFEGRGSLEYTPSPPGVVRNQAYLRAADASAHPAWIVCPPDHAVQCRKLLGHSSVDPLGVTEGTLEAWLGSHHVQFKVISSQGFEAVVPESQRHAGDARGVITGPDRKIGVRSSLSGYGDCDSRPHLAPAGSPSATPRHLATYLLPDRRASWPIEAVCGKAPLEARGSPLERAHLPRTSERPRSGRGTVSRHRQRARCVAAQLRLARRDRGRERPTVRLVECARR